MESSLGSKRQLMPSLFALIGGSTFFDSKLAPELPRNHPRRTKAVTVRWDRLLGRALPPK